MNVAMLSIGLIALLEKIPEQAGKEEVHRLRTSVRRLEVHLHRCPPKVAKSLKCLRKKAGTVRDIDVHIGLLKSPLHSRNPHDKAQLEKAQSKLREILKSSRARHLDSLRELVADSAPLLETRLPTLVEHASDRTPNAQQTLQQAMRAREQFLKWTREIPEDAQLLHQLRINTKKLRYSLEPLEADEECAELGAKFKLVQDAIGSWHDWVTLANLAERELKSSESQPVCGLLRARTDREYRKARRSALNVRTWIASSKPVASAVGDRSLRLVRKAG